MTVVLWIVGVLFGLGILIAWTRVGVRASFREEVARVNLNIGPFHIQILPGKPKPEKQETNPKSETTKTPVKKKKPSRPSFGEIRELCRTLWPPLKQALGRTRRRIRITPLQLAVTVAGEQDPAEAAQLYGELQGAVWTGMPVLEQLLDIRDPYIHVGIDFDAAETKMEGTLGVSIRIGSAIRIALGLAIPALRWFLNFRKRHTPQAQPEQAAGVAN